MKVTKIILREMIEQELSLLNEENEKEALRSYFSINTQIELKQGNKGDIVTALQDFLIKKSNEGALSAVEEITAAIKAMGEPDGNIGPKSVDVIKAFQKHFDLEETGIYNSTVHEAIAGPAPVPETPEAVETDDESDEQKNPGDPEVQEKEESADFPHPKWDALIEELSGADARELKNLKSEEAKTLIEDIKKTFRSKLIDFVKGFRLNEDRGNKSLHIDMKKEIRNKFVGRVPIDDPSWVLIDNLEEEFNLLVDEQQKDKIFDDKSGTTASSYGSLPGQDDGTTSALKSSFKESFIDDTGEFVPLLTIGDFMNIKGVIKLKAVYLGINEIIEKWDVVTRVEEAEPEETDQSVQLTESRFQKLAGI